MAGDDELEFYAQATDMGFDQELAKAAWKEQGHFGKEAAFNFMLGGGANSDVDGLPALVADDVLHDVVLREAAPPPARPSTPRHSLMSTIDLTEDDDELEELPPLVIPSKPQLLLEAGPASSTDPDFERAIQASLQTISAVGPEDAALNNALEASVVSYDVGNALEEKLRTMKPEDRVRSNLSSPIILRTLSPHLSGFAAYLQCLYAVPSWRTSILNRNLIEGRWDGIGGFKDYWKGILGPEPPLNFRADKARYHVNALQNLFSLMCESRRSFVHLSEVARALEIKESDFRSGGDWVDTIGTLHENLVADVLRVTEAEIDEKLKNGALDEAAATKEIERTRKTFKGVGRSLTNDQHISAPLRPPLFDEVSENPCLLPLIIDPYLSAEETIFTCIDRNVVRPDPAPGFLDLVDSVPATIAFKITRRSDFPLAEFGTGRKKEVFKLPLEFWFDRYLIKNRKVISEGRQEIDRLETLRKEKRESRKRIATTADGKDAVELVRTYAAYVEQEQATTEDPTRAARQRQLSLTYSAVLKRMESTIIALDEEIERLTTDIDAVFSSPNMQKAGPFELRSILVRNGLNGRGSSWSVVKDDEGKWWRIRDLSKEVVSVTDALADVSGLQMDAGICMAFYQNASHEVPALAIPPHLSVEVECDNQALSTELPVELAASLNLSPPSADFDSLAIATPTAFIDSDSAMLDDPPPYETNHTSIDYDGKSWEAAPEPPLSPSKEEDSMQLRGGSTNQIEEEYSDDEGQDEPEVELGILQALPPGSAWDVDLGVGKAGGLPRWLDPSSPLSAAEISCSKCSGMMSFLLQMNSPDSERAHAAARSLYLYACSQCSSFKVFRTQMPSPNEFYPHSLETKRLREQLESQLDSATHLVPSEVLGCKPAPVWPEWEIVCEPEPWQESYLPETPSDSAHRGSLGNDEGAEERDEDEEEEETIVGVEIAFLRFQERISRVPEQVIRFYRLPGVETPEPLWISNERVPRSSIPPCSLCGAPRELEVQVLSTLLTYLDELDLELDSALIYTCTQNCEIPETQAGRTGWAEEHLERQFFGKGGVSFGRGAA